ncbi:hypothetical protein M9H77_12952 [Catharanthus roseus]|uniref:Uncharacterized protein n=1 Tax=Catharanthus roseus TaxID=4058 RepID=A0ACC0BJ02_CATRO|nr:hypothetical protein M9H77_12952 [Catharanthus roseus]
MCLARRIKQGIYPGNLLSQLHNLLSSGLNPLLAPQTIATDVILPDPTPNPIHGAISGPSTNSSSERSITGIGSLSGTISLREYEDYGDDVVLLRSSTRLPSLGVPRAKSGSQNEAIGSKFQHLVVNTSQTPYKRSITNNRTPISLVKTGYKLLGHLPGLPWGQPQFRAPPDSPLGDRPTAEHDAMSN